MKKINVTGNHHFDGEKLDDVFCLFCMFCAVVFYL